MAYRMDVFAVFMLLGLVQAVFLSFFFFSAQHRVRQPNVLLGALLLAIAGCLLEIFLMYTGYIVHALHLVDFSEPLALLIGPLLYLLTRSLAESALDKKTILLHTLFPVVYTLLLIPFLAADADFKYNSWIEAYHPGMSYRETMPDYDPRFFGLTDWHTELVLISLGFYLVLSAHVIVQSFRLKNENFWKPESLTLKTMRNGVLHIAAFTLLMVPVKLLNKNDTGDHYFAAFGSLMIYATSFSVMRNSGFFRQPALNEPVKYKTSTLSHADQQKIITKIEQLMTEQKPYLNPSFSLPELADQLHESVHGVSQAINDGLGKNFFELIAGYRVEEAKKLLKEQMNIKVEEIAEQVGYSSKSSFNTAFKKNTGMTPSEFRQR